MFSCKVYLLDDIAFFFLILIFAVDFLFCFEFFFFFGFIKLNYEFI